jgi:hypothetical protein
MSLLPVEFSGLEALIEWSLPTERQRNAKRLSSSMNEIKRFYDTILPQAEAILAYLDRFPLDEMPDQDRHLLYLVLSLAEVANAVELFKNPAVIDGFDPTRIALMHE